MINKTKIRIPKKYNKMIKEVYHDSDDYWVLLNENYCHDVDENSVIHEETVKGVLYQIKFIKERK